MLEEHGVEYRYRDYKKEPLDEAELRDVLAALGVGPRDMLRRRDKACRELGLSGDEPEDRLIELMARHPTLLERPIALRGDRAVVGRPPETILGLAD